MTKKPKSTTRAAAVEPEPMPTVPLADEWYKLVNGERVPMTPKEIEEFIANQPPPLETPAPPPNPNERIDRAMEALYAALPETPDAPEIRRMDEQHLADYVAGLSQAVREMMLGFRAIQPRSK